MSAAGSGAGPAPTPIWVRLAADAALIATGIAIAVLMPGQTGDFGGGAAIGAGLRGLYALSGQ